MCNYNTYIWYILKHEKISIDIKKLTEELQSKKYSQKEIKNILAWIEDIHNGDVCTLEEVYESLFNKKQIHIHA